MGFSLNTSIRQKLILNSAFVSLGLFLMLLLFFHVSQKNEHNNKLIELIDKIQIQALKLNIEEMKVVESKGKMGNNEHTKKFDELKNYITLFAEANTNTESATMVDEYRDATEEYKAIFDRFLKKLKNNSTNDSADLNSLVQSRNSIISLQNAMVANLKEQIESDNDLNYLANIVIFIAVTALVLLSGFITRKNVLQQIMMFSDSVQKIRTNNDLTLKINVAGQDEVSQMGVQVNSLIDEFRDLILKVNEVVYALDETSTAVVNNSIKNQESLDSQLHETESVAAAVTEMGATIKEIVANTEEAETKAENCNTSARNGAQQVVSTIESINILSDNLNFAVTDVNALAVDSKNVGSVLDVIRGIAEQTNLLALNAAIEAARAGENGRGFAVVADEVRTLAMKTQESTKEIESIIGSLQSRIENIVKVIDECQEQGTISTQRSKEAGEQLQMINQDVDAIMDMNTQIATAIEQQSTVAEEVNQNVVNIRDDADRSSQRAKDNVDSSQNISSHAKELRKRIEKYKV